MNLITTFMASPVGRGIRVLAGGGLIAWGLVGMGTSSPVGITIAAIGVLPILTGVFNICLLGPLLGAPLSGSKMTNQAR